MKDVSQFIFTPLNVHFPEGWGGGGGHRCVTHQQLADVSQFSEEVGWQDHQG